MTPQRNIPALRPENLLTIAALALLVAGCFIIVNFFMDVMYAMIDPRIRYR